MVGSINNGYQQPPIANTFKPGQELDNQLNRAKTGENGINASPADSLRQTTKIDSSTEKFQLGSNLNQDSGKVSSSVNRGSQLDISV
jgi:hypothetical protein